MIWYKRTKNIIIAINKITLKKSLMCNMDEKNFIYRPFPAIWIRTSCLMYKATCNNTIANIQKAIYNVKKKIY